jgi:hypothetical protein
MEWRIYNGAVADAVALAGGGGSLVNYENQNYERTSNYIYVGSEVVSGPSAGQWFIYRRTITTPTSIREYAYGPSDYTTSWTNRSILTYA